MNKFFKYHALGNDYMVVDPTSCEQNLTPGMIRLICHRNFGVGSDGILWGPIPSDNARYGLRIFNPDGSEAEKSGNGLRIFSRYLWDQKRVGEEKFTLETLGGLVSSTIFKEGKLIEVEMGQVSFWSDKIPVVGKRREVLKESIQAGDRTFEYCAATIGNPHCVIPLDEISESATRHYGPLLETHENFPNRTNVQFLKALDPQNIQIEIWERGAGYTLASGSSSSACAAVARKLGLCGDKVTVHMPGGKLSIEMDQDNSVLMTGPATRICEGELDSGMFENGAGKP
jgi:diaminopimelate epimerase